MKFAKEIEEELVPEWASKYLDYKAGKKKIKAVVKAIDKTNTIPRSGSNKAAKTPLLEAARNSQYQPSPLSKGDGHPNDVDPASRDANGGRHGEHDDAIDSDSGDSSDDGTNKKMRNSTETTPIMIPEGRVNGNDGRQPLSRYGSIIATPPKHAHIKNSKWDLPDPAIAPSDAPDSDANGGTVNSTSSTSKHAYEVGNSRSPKKPHFGKGTKTGPAQKRVKNEEIDEPPRGLRRLFSTTSPLSRPSSNQAPDYNMEAHEKVRTTRRDFFTWMDGQLDKIETFYKSKEDDADARMEILRDQLHTMRNNRMKEIQEAHRIEEALREREERALHVFGVKIARPKQQEAEPRYSWRMPIERALDNIARKTMGPNSKALAKMPFSPAMAANLQETIAESVTNAVDPNSDYTRRPMSHEVSYRVAKRKLKLALKEFYRALELLKSYSLLNRTAFRKINKKYDKATTAEESLKYFYDKVQGAHFNQSDLLDKHLHGVEDLYARYFERGNHKVAVGKLRSNPENPGQYIFPAFRSGVCLGLGTVLSIQGLVWAFQIEADFPDDAIETQTSYLLQLYAAYFLALYLFTFFAIDCGIWTRFKINYPFIFEFDPRHHLDWRQLAEFPCILFFFFGLIMWVNFSRYGSDAMYLYYPVILFGVTALLIFFPAPTLWHRSRKWFVYSHWRLLLAGLYPVEFRDFFLGDMYCSLTYFMGNIELFFCLYANHWTNETQCNSSNSRLLGFFAALPGVWRALQSLRRYYDTRNAFPHLANFGKYIATVLYYTSLSLFRIHKSTHMLAIFIVFAAINAIYTSIWDLLMDWSLFQPGSHPFLRPTLGYKSPTFYYFAMISNVILRFNWVFYVAYTRDLQHSSVCSFLVAFSEINRRGIWTLIRVENEHCTNVQSFKASRDIKLPYDIPGKVKADESTSSIDTSSPTPTDQHPPTPPSTHTRHKISNVVEQLRKRTHKTDQPDTDAEAESQTSGWKRWGSPRQTLTKVLANAHRQDFEKKKGNAGKKEDGEGLGGYEAREESSDDDDWIDGGREGDRVEEE